MAKVSDYHSVCLACQPASKPTVFFSRIKLAPATSQPAVLFSHNKLAPVISHSQANRVMSYCKICVLEAIDIMIIDRY